MSSSSWARAGRPRDARPRPAVDAFGIAVELAREHWERLTGARPPVSDAAAAAILETARALWPSVAATVDDDGRP